MSGIGTPPAKLILVSYAVAHDMGSEPGVGWQFLLAAQRYAARHGIPLHLVTNGRSADKIFSWQQANPGQLDADVHVVRVPGETKLQGKFERLAYFVWIALCRRLLLRLANSADSTVIHQVTFASEVLPVALPRRGADTLRRIWGPVGSTGAAWAFEVGPQSRGLRRVRRMQLGRDWVANAIARRQAGRADTVLLQSEFVRPRFDGGGHVVFPNFLPPAELLGQHRMPSDAPRMQLVCVGQLIRLKRVDLAIRALAIPVLHKAELTVLGDGPQLAELQDLATAMGVAERVHFEGEVPRTAVVRAMQTCDALVHLSAREGASGAVAEASMVGLPVVCFAGTGAASTLRQGGGGGVEIAAAPLPTIDVVANCIHEASHLSMVPVRNWDITRLDTLIEEIYVVPEQP